LLLSAIRWVSSLRLTAPPVFWEASRISNASFSDILFPPRWRAKRTIQRRVLDPLAMRVLEGHFLEGDTVVVDADSREGLTFKKEEMVKA